MPIPFIPAIIIVGGAIIGGKGLYDSIDASFIREEAEKKFNERRKRYEDYYRYYETTIRDARKQFEDFGVIRMEAYKNLQTSAKILKKAVVKNRIFNDKLGVSQAEINNWDLKSGDALNSVVNIVSSAGVGYATAAGMYTAVTIFCSASTGTAISSLSGIAAKNAALAWFGGGAISVGGGGIALGTTVLGVVALAPALFIFGLSRKSSAENFKTEVEAKIAEMDIEEEKMKNQLAELAVIIRRKNELEKSIIKVNSTLKKLILNIQSSKDFSMSDYNYEKQLYEFALTAKALSQLLDQKIA